MAILITVQCKACRVVIGSEPEGNDIQKLHGILDKIMQHMHARHNGYKEGILIYRGTLDGVYEPFDTQEPN